MTDALRRDLIDGDADLDIRAVGLARARAGEERRVGAGMIAGAIVAGLRVEVIEPPEDLKRTLQRRERFHRFGEREIRALALRPPVILMRAIRKINKRH